MPERLKSPSYIRTALSSQQGILSYFLSSFIFNLLSGVSSFRDCLGVRPMILCKVYDTGYILIECDLQERERLEAVRPGPFGPD